MRLGLRPGDPLRAGPIRSVVSDQADFFVSTLVSGEEVNLAPVPPFVSSASADLYGSVSPSIEGLNFSVQWKIRGWPGYGIRVWWQSVVDGIEVDNRQCEEDCDPQDFDPDLSVEIEFTDFCRFVSGIILFRELANEARIGGSVAALASVSYLVSQPTWLRSKAVSRPSSEIVEAFDLRHVQVTT